MGPLKGGRCMEWVVNSRFNCILQSNFYQSFSPFCYVLISKELERKNQINEIKEVALHARHLPTEKR